MSDSGYFHDYDEVYCYPHTGVLINKLGIEDPGAFSKLETTVTALRMAELDSNPELGSYDLNHLKAIHRRIFGDLFDWAGEIRTVEISKGIPFCFCCNIESTAHRLFEELSEDHYLRGLDRDSIIMKLAYYLGEINAIHPFREGNGRVQRKFIEQLARQAGYPLSFINVGKKEMIEASVYAINCDYSKMEVLIRGCMESYAYHENDM